MAVDEDGMDVDGVDEGAVARVGHEKAPSS